MKAGFSFATGEIPGEPRQKKRPPDGTTNVIKTRSYTIPEAKDSVKFEVFGQVRGVPIKCKDTVMFDISEQRHGNILSQRDIEKCTGMKVPHTDSKNLGHNRACAEKHISACARNHSPPVSGLGGHLRPILFPYSHWYIILRDQSMSGSALITSVRQTIQRGPELIASPAYGPLNDTLGRNPSSSGRNRRTLPRLQWAVQAQSRHVSVLWYRTHYAATDRHAIRAR